jgi:hypothetical protein
MGHVGALVTDRAPFSARCLKAACRFFPKSSKVDAHRRFRITTAAVHPTGEANHGGDVVVVHTRLRWGKPPHNIHDLSA